MELANPEDRTPATLTNFDLDMNSNTLTLTFDDVIESSSVSSSSITLLNLPESYQLTSVTPVTNNDFIVELIVSEFDIIGIKSSLNLATSKDTTFLSLLNSAFQDTSSLSIIPADQVQVQNFVPDTTPPELLSFGLDVDSGFLILYFNEPVNVSTLMVGLLQIQDRILFASESYVLTSNDISVNLNLTHVTINLADTDDLQSIKNTTLIATQPSNTFLSFPGDTIRDTFNNGIAGFTTGILQSQFLPDSASPILVAFPIFDLDSGLLTLSFSEPIVVQTLNFSAFILTHTFTEDFSDSQNYYRLTGGICTVSISCSDSDRITFKLTDFDLNQIKSRELQLCVTEESCLPVIDASFAHDHALNSNFLTPVLTGLNLASNKLLSQLIADTTSPTLLGSESTLDLNADLLIMVFDEPIQVSSLLVSSITIHELVTGGQSFSLSSSTTLSSNLTSITLSLNSDADELKARSFATSVADTFISIYSTAIEDVATFPP